MRLNDICTAIVDCEHKTAPEGDGYALSVGTRAMKDGRLVIDACKLVSEETYIGWSRRMVPVEGDLVLAREAPVGQVIRIPSSPRICLGQRTVLIRPDSARVHPRFLHYWLLGPDAQGPMAAQAAGATVAHLNVEDIRRLDISKLPGDRTHQRPAAETLGGIDDLIENNRRRVEVLEEMARAIYREWFVHFRYPGHENARFVDSSIGEVPEGWLVAPASAALTINPRVKLDKAVEHLFVTMGDLDERNMIFTSSELRVGNSGAKFVNADTLFARITPCLENGKTGYVQCLDDAQVGRGSTEFIVLRGGAVGPAFTYCLARSERFRAHAIASMSGASGRQRVRNECFDAYLLAIPPRHLVDRFEGISGPLFETAHRLSLQSRKLSLLRDLLLPKLVTGQIDVSSLDLDALVESSVA